jgi:glycosyltransferase involved in cell wall biosynthesis
MFVRALLRQCEQLGLDFRFCTTLAFSAADWRGRLLPKRLRKEILRRDFGITRTRIKRRPAREFVRLLAGRFGWSLLTGHERGWASVDAVYRDLDRHVARQLQSGDCPRKVTTVHAYEDGAFETFREARARGIQCSYELPIVYWETAQRLLREEAERLPAWEPTLGATRDSAAKLERKTRELELADTVICPSQFVVDSLPAKAREKKTCTVAQFGSPQSDRPVTAQLDGESVQRKSLRLLFAGSLTQRKGLADVFAAMQLLRRPEVELVVMGASLLPIEFYRRHYAAFQYEPPRPHPEVLELMRHCDVLVLPSIVEGRALVQQEALSCGLPLIVTRNAGGEDLIEPGQTGFLVPIRSPAAIAEKITWFADHRDSLSKMRELCEKKAAELTWKRYAQRILATWDPV